jgi:rhodanese-related sulfurtransferase
MQCALSTTSPADRAQPGRHLVAERGIVQLPRLTSSTSAWPAASQRRFSRRAARPTSILVTCGSASGARAEGLPRDRDVSVVCRSGTRSACAAQALTAGGLNAVNVADGMTGWAVAGRPMISEDGTEPHVA